MPPLARAPQTLRLNRPQPWGLDVVEWAQHRHSNELPDASKTFKQVVITPQIQKVLQFPELQHHSVFFEENLN